MVLLGRKARGGPVGTKMGRGPKGCERCCPPCIESTRGGTFTSHQPPARVAQNDPECVTGRSVLSFLCTQATSAGTEAAGTEVGRTHLQSVHIPTCQPLKDFGQVVALRALGISPIYRGAEEP